MRIKTKFGILKDWKISIIESREYSGQCGVNEKKKKAIIYDMNPRPSDFVTHELLHLCLRAFLKMDKRKWKELREVEEQFVQELCGAIYPEEIEVLRGEESKPP